MEHCHGGLEDAFHLEIGWFVGSSRSSSRVYPQCISFGLGYTPAMSAWQVPVTKWRKGRWCLGGVGMAKFDQPNWYVNFSRNGLYRGNPGTTYEEHPQCCLEVIFDSMDFDYISRMLFHIVIHQLMWYIVSCRVFFPRTGNNKMPVTTI